MKVYGRVDLSPRWVDARAEDGLEMPSTCWGSGPPCAAEGEYENDGLLDGAHLVRSR